LTAVTFVVNASNTRSSESRPEPPLSSPPCRWRISVPEELSVRESRTVCPTETPAAEASVSVRSPRLAAAVIVEIVGIDPLPSAQMNPPLAPHSELPDSLWDSPFHVE
jgi:hypothetical protein